MARNRASDTIEFSAIKESYNYEKRSYDTKYCIFISHKYEDRFKAKYIADYIENKGNIDVYLDQNDFGLQGAVQREDDKAIVRHIERGLSASTHILCLISDDTHKSWWVPYEVGYAKRGKKIIASLKLKDVINIPSFLKIEKQLNGIKTLNNYLRELEGYETNNFTLISETTLHHPLDNYLNWKE